MDDHLQKVWPQKGGFVHDGRVTDTYPISYYVENGMIGSLVNDALGSGLPVNVVVEFYDGPYQHPNGQVVDGLCVFKTCVDCREGDEALRNYGPTHRLCHFDLQQSERDADLEKAKDMPPPSTEKTACSVRSEQWGLLIEPFKLCQGSFQSSRKRGPVNAQPVTPNLAKQQQRRTAAELLLAESTSSASDLPEAIVSRRQQQHVSEPAQESSEPCWPREAAPYVKTGVAETQAREEREAGTAQRTAERPLTLEKAKQQLEQLRQSNNNLRRRLRIAENVKSEFERAVKTCDNARRYDTAVDSNSTFQKEVEMMIEYRRKLAELYEEKQDELEELCRHKAAVKRVRTVGQKRKRESEGLLRHLKKAHAQQKAANKRQKRRETKERCSQLENELESAILSDAPPAVLKANLSQDGAHS